MNNVPNANLSGRLKDNPGKTGNLQTILKLKVNAPVSITSNHPKKKYKEEGIINGARGNVQSIQVSKNNPEKLDVVWVVLTKRILGNDRFEHRHLRQTFNSGHELATPNLPERKHLKKKYGN